MTYKLKFLPVALKEWKKLDPSIRVQLRNKLEEIIQNPKIPANRLRQFENHYKIKLKSSGYRLVYEVIDTEIVVLVIAIGKREGNKVYEVARLRT
ncbi:mRNA interferase RelE/StbE [Desulfobotulus alkaliphilus]|uniref:mRNA interferase RelE/StbE n=1 Tax=Desulfobotulus alkaliphilus TaxID=622671 RepID=A0A562RHI6_9BACT|nr:type II toxin-antitoxin system RelE/ParE family toxin [Desulfobotulus alkaliphilus]TWI68572.1 mRNA interferase RelE/StbE [Desulfobotulus alkaliphilus]